MYYLKEVRKSVVEENRESNRIERHVRMLHLLKYKVGVTPNRTKVTKKQDGGACYVMKSHQVVFTHDHYRPILSAVERAQSRS